MKRKIYFLIICMILQLILSTSSAMAITVETMYNGNSSSLISTDGNLPEFVQINGETYLGDSIRNTCIQIKDDPAICDVLKQPGYDWDFDGEYYLRRVSSADDSPLRYRVKAMTFSIFDKVPVEQMPKASSSCVMPSCLRDSHI